jgi:hypothetical protein
LGYPLVAALGAQPVPHGPYDPQESG